MNQNVTCERETFRIAIGSSARRTGGVASNPEDVVPLGWPSTARAFAGDPTRIAVNNYRANDKHGDPAEWPADLRVREFPEVPRG